MTWRSLAIGAGWTVCVFAAAFLAFAGWSIRSPVLMAWRPWPIIVFCLACLALVAVAMLASRKAGRAGRVLAVVPGLLALAAGLWREADAYLIRRAVLAAPASELRAAARHVIAGFGRFDELAPLAITAGVAGLFVTRRNVAGLGAEALAREIDRLQGQRRAAGLPPLWIATDQEGGLVSALSPPLPAPAALSTLAHSGDLVITATEKTGRELACAGINVNFAPVVDVSRRVVEPGDRLSQISRRAISSDERVVAQTARDYCRSLAESGVQCTLKHFPGLGPVKGDTHVTRATLPELLDIDLFPFRELALEERPWIMMGHVVIETLDAERPASASAEVIGVLRRDWGFDGVLVTDDASMRAYVEDFSRNVVDSLRNGVDLLLVSWDTDLVWESLDLIIRESRADPAFARALARGKERLDREPARAPFCRRLASR